ncbi:hypothetical protein [Xanthobacter sp.]|uniref:hypothetical protein n=1 Tax=Xanthobacter sp. TaxID=35809 RepID=UPI0025DC3F30|nr:hypothetical protein [Xanthobacter sp.]
MTTSAVSRQTDIVLGAELTDRKTGFRGVASGFCVYISGNEMVLLEKSEDGHSEYVWVDVERVRPISANDAPGCDKPAPIR